MNPAPLPFEPAEAHAPRAVADEALAPLAATLATRGARGLPAVCELARTPRRAGPSPDAPEPALVHLAMRGSEERRPALGRLLDPGWRPAIERGLEPEDCNRAELRELDRALAAVRPVLAASLQP